MPAPKKAFNPYGTLNKAYNILNKATAKSLTGSSKNAALKKPYPKKVKPELKKPLKTPKPNVKVIRGPLTAKQTEAKRISRANVRTYKRMGL